MGLYTRVQLDRSDLENLLRALQTEIVGQQRICELLGWEDNETATAQLNALKTLCRRLEVFAAQATDCDELMLSCRRRMPPPA